MKRAATAIIGLFELNFALFLCFFAAGLMIIKSELAFALIMAGLHQAYLLSKEEEFSAIALIITISFVAGFLFST